MTRFLAAMIVTVLTAPAWADGPDGSWALSMDGLGNLKIGMNQEQMQRVLRQPIPYNEYNNHGCSFMTTPSLGPLGISLMIEKKRLVRINIDYYGTDPHPLLQKTEAGIGLGSSEADLLKAYPTAEVKANPADPTWHTVTVDAPDHSKGMVFETDGKKVKSFRVGANPAIAYATGCL